MLFSKLLLSFLIAFSILLASSGNVADKMVGEWTWDDHPQSHIWILKNKVGYTFSVVDTLVKDLAIFDPATGTLTAQLTNGRKVVIAYLPKDDKLELRQLGGGDSDLGKFSRFRK